MAVQMAARKVEPTATQRAVLKAASLVYPMAAMLAFRMVVRLVSRTVVATVEKMADWKAALKVDL